MTKNKLFNYNYATGTEGVLVAAAASCLSAASFSIFFKSEWKSVRSANQAFVMIFFSRLPPRT
jgi:hypothetical protein